ncbi:hypothetical protein Tco_1023112, partial [Tanacetum coccineum]
ARDGPLSIEDARAQMKEMKRLADLKARKEKSEKKLKDMTPAKMKAQAEQLAAYKVKREKILEEYNHCINFRVDPLPITKINYMMLGFSEWLEVHDLPYKVKSNSNDLLLKNLKTKFQWAKTQARKLGIPPPPQLTAFGLTASEKKRKRSS